jgi:hypothetical protein
LQEQQTQQQQSIAVDTTVRTMKKIFKLAGGLRCTYTRTVGQIGVDLSIRNALVPTVGNVELVKVLTDLSMPSVLTLFERI